MSIEYPDKDLAIIIKALAAKKYTRLITDLVNPPAGNYGKEGDIAIIVRATNAWLYVKKGSRWYVFNSGNTNNPPSSSSGKTTHIIDGGFYRDSTVELWIPLSGTSEQTSIVAFPSITNFIWPRNGRVKKICYKQVGWDASFSFISIKIYKLALNEDAGDETKWSAVNLNSVVNQLFEMREVPIEGVSFTKGETMSISFNSSTRDIKHIMFTIELEFDN